MSDDLGANSPDECSVCGRTWSKSDEGWPLCDSCDGVVCKDCVAGLNLVVSDLFYCPTCSGAGETAAATAGGAVASAVKACADIDGLPMSKKALRRVLQNLLDSPDEAKFRKLRLSNKKVKELLDLEPVRRILESVGFTQCDEITTIPDTDEKQRSQVLVLEGNIDVEQVAKFVEILDSLDDESKGDKVVGPKATFDGNSDEGSHPNGAEPPAKRIREE